MIIIIVVVVVIVVVVISFFFVIYVILFSAGFSSLMETAVLIEGYIFLITNTFVHMVKYILINEYFYNHTQKKKPHKVFA